jgi:hypothetical protein
VEGKGTDECETKANRPTSQSRSLREYGTGG